MLDVGPSIGPFPPHSIALNRVYWSVRHVRPVTHAAALRGEFVALGVPPGIAVPYHDVDHPGPITGQNKAIRVGHAVGGAHPADDLEEFGGGVGNCSELGGGCGVVHWGHLALRLR